MISVFFNGLITILAGVPLVVLVGISILIFILFGLSQTIKDAKFSLIGCL
ncbi:hypothetical protein P4J12_33365 [Bacillus cereus]|nr:hypothetical protein [Bacillus cereus]